MDKIAYQMGEAVTASGLSRAYLYREIRDGRLRAIKTGGRRLILRRDLEAYFDNLEKGAG